VHLPTLLHKAHQRVVGYIHKSMTATLHFTPSYFFFSLLGLALRACTYSHSTTHPFFVCVMCFFWDRVSWSICQGWLQTETLLISASWVARLIGVSHRCPALHSLIASKSKLSRPLAACPKHPAWNTKPTYTLLGFHILHSIHHLRAHMHFTCWSYAN
jgi:hypothetical protein